MTVTRRSLLGSMAKLGGAGAVAETLALWDFLKPAAGARREPRAAEGTPAAARPSRSSAPACPDSARPTSSTAPATIA